MDPVLLKAILQLMCDMTCNAALLRFSMQVSSLDLLALIAGATVRGKQQGCVLLTISVDSLLKVVLQLTCNMIRKLHMAYCASAGDQPESVGAGCGRHVPRRVRTKFMKLNAPHCLSIEGRTHYR